MSTVPNRTTRRITCRASLRTLAGPRAGNRSSRATEDVESAQKVAERNARRLLYRWAAAVVYCESGRSADPCQLLRRLSGESADYATDLVTLALAYEYVAAIPSYECCEAALRLRYIQRDETASPLHDEFFHALVAKIIASPPDPRAIDEDDPRTVDERKQQSLYHRIGRLALDPIRNSNRLAKAVDELMRLRAKAKGLPSNNT